MLVAAVIAAVALFFILLDAWCPKPLSGPACPYDWIGYHGRCYFFSKEQRNWTFSKTFCSLQEAHLLTFSPTQEKEFVMRYKGKAPFWIGLSRDPGQPWKWTDGDISTLKIIGDGGDCAFLNSRADATSSRCRTELRWICSKHDIFKNQNTR
ncbi:hypothetical protein JD844_013432 [Phrynosoma platyrhinos]|uniref:C-type lectin domain-containing protein n=1 Tax=Phrynosoma platyrhinos TaxID=52577 RepID=A0ABQ7TKT4_PHRPL|nr:hypothetical protein JD844_013432 [Phrynosoma platyrhinos]